MINWQLCRFDEFSLNQLYQVLALRQAVFVVEQDCPYQDADDQDQQALHLMAYQAKDLVAYARIFAPDEDNLSRIGRVLNSDKLRGQGLGRELMQRAIDYCATHWPDSPIHISGQCYLERFYQELGFVKQGEPYLEDDIPHVSMRLHHRDIN